MPCWGEFVASATRSPRKEAVKIARLSERTEAGNPVLLGGFGEDRDNVGGGRGPKRRGRQGTVSAVVVDDVEYFDVASVLQRDVGHVCLPALIRECGFEADVGAVWGRLCGSGVMNPRTGEDPPNTRG